MDSLNKIAKHCLEISNKRLANGANMTTDALKHCGEELVEAVQARERMRLSTDDTPVDKFADELMDVVVCVLIECAENDIDVEKALLECINKNNKRALCIGDKL